MLIKIGNWSKRFVQEFTGLLDSYPNAAAAYSLRKLSATYSGSAVRVRRSSDDSELDIGFSGNELDQAALTAFVGANDGFVATWYDQSGNLNDATQSTAMDQPQIFQNGSMVTENSGFAINFNGIIDGLDFTNVDFFTNVSYGQVFAVAQADNNTGNGRIVSVSTAGGVGGTRYLMGDDDTGTNPQKFRIGGRRLDTDSFQEIISNTKHSNSQKLLAGEVNWIDAEANLYQNGTLVASADPFQTAGNTDTTTPTGTNNGIGKNNYDGRISEVIIYQTNESSNRAAIEENINNYWEIY